MMSFPVCSSQMLKARRRSLIHDLTHDPGATQPAIFISLLDGSGSGSLTANMGFIKYGSNPPLGANALLSAGLPPDRLPV